MPYNSLLETLACSISSPLWLFRMTSSDVYLHPNNSWHITSWHTSVLSLSHKWVMCSLILLQDIQCECLNCAWLQQIHGSYHWPVKWDICKIHSSGCSLRARQHRWCMLLMLETFQLSCKKCLDSSKQLLIDKSHSHSLGTEQIILELCFVECDWFKAA